MTHSQPAKVGAWLLALSPLAFVVYTIDGIVFFGSTGVASWAQISHQLMGEVRGAWIVGQVLFLLPYLMGTTGTFLVARALLRSPARPWAIVSIVVAAVALSGNATYAGLMVAASGFEGDLMGESQFGVLATGPIVQFWSDPAAWATTIAFGITVWRAGVRPTLGRVVAVIGAVALVAAVATGFAPPFAVSFLWCALGIGWLRARVLARR